MTVYHFCNEKSIRGIMTDGITRGMVPGYTLIPAPRGKKKVSTVVNKGWQWLTLDGDPNGQSWATSELIKENRLEYRLTVEIPEKELDSLYDKEKFLTVFPNLGPLFDPLEGSKNWRIFRGNISKYWIRAAERWNPELKEWEKYRRK